MAERFLWGIDLGGTKIEAVILDTQLGFKIIERRRIDTNAHLGYNKVLQSIKLLLDNIVQETGIGLSNVGIGTPGSINPYNQKLRNCNSVYLNDHTFRLDLEKAIGVPIRMSNDANCFAISEYKIGVVADEIPDAKVVFGAILGTGVGSGIVVNGQILEGKNGIGGEWGHNYLDNSGGPCYCGKIGCVETVISGPALEKYYSERTGIQIGLHEIVEKFRRNSDPIASVTMKRLFHFFSKAIANVINIIDPDAIVIGGGLGNIEELYSLGIKELPDYVFSEYIETKFLKPKFGDSSGVLGAALLWH